MIYAYDRIYLEEARRKLARMLDYAVNDLNLDICEFYDWFISSSIAKGFENGDASIVCGRSGVESVYMIIEEKGIDIEIVQPRYTVNRSAEYWTGYVLAYFQWRTSLPYKKINEFISIDRVEELYNPYHEMDIRSFYDKMVELYMEHNPDTNLKMKRKSVGLSQSDLAILTEIPVRTIQQYEQRQKDINKASMEYMYKLSKVLACEPKELMEFVINK